MEQINRTLSNNEDVNTNYTLLNALPAPGITDSKNSNQIIKIILLPILTAIAVGIALFIASRILYVYIVYNYLAGIAIGHTMVYCIGKKTYSSQTFLFLVSVLCSLVVYISFNVTYMQYAFFETNLKGIGFIEFIQIRADSEKFIKICL